MPKVLFRKPTAYDASAATTVAEPPAATAGIEQQLAAQRRTVADYERRLAEAKEQVAQLEADYRRAAASEARGDVADGEAEAIRQRIIALGPRRDGLVEAVRQETARLNELASEAQRVSAERAAAERRAMFERLPSEYDALAADLATHIEALATGLARLHALGAELQQYAEFGGPAIAQRGRETVLAVRARLSNAGYDPAAGLQLTIIPMRRRTHA